MRVLITRPEREATALAKALTERGHSPVIAPLFSLEILQPPPGFAAALAACQAVLLTSANGARALAEASEQRGRPIYAVGDTTAATAEGLGFSAVTSASNDGAALAELVRSRLDPKGGPLLHVSGMDVAFDLSAALGRDGFEVHRFALYDAREETSLPASARAALEARALEVVTFFSPRASEVFARLVGEAGLSDSLRPVTAIAISPAALAPLTGLPFKAALAAPRPTRQAVLDEIDRLTPTGLEGDSLQGQETMSDVPSSPPPDMPPAPAQARRGMGVVGAFITGVLAAILVLAGALISLPFWPERVRAMWQGETSSLPPPAATPAIDLQAVRADASAVANAAVDAAKRELGQRLDELEKRLHALSTAVAERPAVPDAAIAELRAKVQALESRPAATQAAPATPSNAEADKEIATLNREIAALRSSVQTLEQSVANQREQANSLKEAVTARGTAEQKALGAARASALVGVAVRLSAALDLGLPFTSELSLLTSLVQGDAKLGEIAAALQPYAQTGVAARAALADDFPTVAKAALAEDLADDSLGARVLGKLRSVVSLRRVGDVPGETVEAKLARAETALKAGDLAKAVALVKSLPPQVGDATSAWLAKAEAHLAAKHGVDQLAAYAVQLLGGTR